VPGLALPPAAVAARVPSAAAAPARRAAPTPGASFAALLEGQRAAAAAPPASPAPSPPAQALRAVEAAQARLDAVLAAARSGRTFTAGELLGLQAEAYRLSQALDVAGKLVEQGVQSVKQAVQTQV
jgi:hypothetical protein